MVSRGCDMSKTQTNQGGGGAAVVAAIPRSRQRGRLLCAVALCVAVLTAGCEDRAARSIELPPVPNPVFKPADLSRVWETDRQALDDFEASENESYTLGAGDRIYVSVWDHPELSGPHVVGPDGDITIPFAGPISLTAATREESAETIANLLASFYVNPIVTVRVDEYSSNRIFILGRVANPGIVPFDGQPTLLEAIHRAGGLPIGGIGAEKAALTRCAIVRGRDQIVWVNLQSLLSGEDLSLNLRLRRNDLLYIPDADDQLVYVLGEVRGPNAYHLTPDMSLLDALARAGGPTPDADPSVMHLIRPRKGVNQIIDIEDLLMPNANLNVSLQKGDIVYVPRRGLAKVGYVLDQLSPIASWLRLGVDIEDTSYDRKHNNDNNNFGN